MSKMPACPNCGAHTGVLFETRDYNQNTTSERFVYYRCGSCRLIFLDPVPTDLSAYYPSLYHYFPKSYEEAAACAKHEQYKVDLVRRYVTKGRLLEVGPSWGGFCFIGKEAGYEVEAIEMDSRCCEFISSVIGVKAVNSADNCKSIRDNGPYDVIAMWHVIEHLSDPWDVLEAVAGNLTPGGIAVIAAPNPDALQFGILGKRWTHVDAPRHVMLIPSRLLVKRAERLGLKTKLITTMDKGSIGWNSFGWEYSIANLSDKAGVKKFLGRTGLAISRLLAPFELIEGRGSAYTVVLQKDKG